MKQENYDIAAAFITDQDTIISTFGIDGDIGYRFTRYGLAEHPYCLTIYAHAKAPAPERFCKKQIKKNHGKIIIHRGTATPNGTRTLLEYKTKQEVGTALDKTKSDARRFFTRIQSPKFFKLVDMAEKRISGQIQTTNNTAQLFNMIYRLKEKQK